MLSRLLRRRESRTLVFAVFVISFFVGATSGAIFGLVGALMFTDDVTTALNRLANEQAIAVRDTAPFIEPSSGRTPSVITAVREVEPAVVSIVVSREVPVNTRQPVGGLFGDDFLRNFLGSPVSPQREEVETQLRRVGGGTGFFVSSDGLIVTNKHVVLEEDAVYTVLLNDGRELDAEVLARDPANDLAVVKVVGEGFPTVQLGDSDVLALGQTVIAVGNALGEFRNTVSVGVISGLSRSITATGARGISEQLTGVIQTDAAINNGNSGGPLADLSGAVIGINTAVSTRGQNIGFAIPVAEVRLIIDSVNMHGRIVRPFLGVRYIGITPEFARANELPVADGAFVTAGNGELAVLPNSPADEAGLVDGDIILEINGERITEEKPLVRVVASKAVGEEITLLVLRGEEELSLKAVLIERE